MDVPACAYLKHVPHTYGTRRHVFMTKLDLPNECCTPEASAPAGSSGRNIKSRTIEFGEFLHVFSHWGLIKHDQTEDCDKS